MQLNVFRDFSPVFPPSGQAGLPLSFGDRFRKMNQQVAAYEGALAEALRVLRTGEACRFRVIVGSENRPSTIA
jgi:hypothetical protein